MMTEGRKHATRDSRVLTYIGLRFNPDKYVFHMLLVLTLVFMVLYTIGMSVPAWYVLEERVTNISTCQSADHYIEPRVRRYWNRGPTKLLLTSSLWFINIRLTNDEDQFNKFVPFIFVQTEHFAVEDRNGLMIDNVLPKCLTSLIAFTFLGLGVAFTCCASNRPSRLIYYGLSATMIVAATTTWVSIAITMSEKYLLSMALDLCLQQGALKTSFLLQMVTGSAGILAFIFGCILIHLAILINTKYNEEKIIEDNDDFISMQEQVSSMYKYSRHCEKQNFTKVYDL